MKLRKIISLIAATSLAISSFAALAVTVSASGSSVAFDVIELDANFTGYESLKSDFDWSKYNDDGLTYKTYIVQIKATGTEYSTEVIGTKSKKMSGTSIVGYWFKNISITSDGSIEDDYQYDYAKALGAPTKNPSAKPTDIAFIGSDPLYPVKADGSTTVTATDKSGSLVEYIITTDTSNPVTLTVGGGEVYFDVFENDAGTTGNSYLVCLAGASVTVPPVSKPDPVPSVTSVTVSPKEVALEVGTAAETTTANLTATVVVENGAAETVTWTTSNEAVATVENGVVTAVGAGTATITATSTVDGTKADTCTVTVVEKKIPVVGISVSIDKATIAIEETATASVVYNPKNADEYTDITWTSSNEDVATVTNGVVTGVKAGTATITATSANGKTAAVEVTVVRPARKITIGDRFVGTEVKGFVWNVKVQWFDGKALNYTFTDKADNATKEGVFGNVSNIEADNMSFDVVMRTNKADVVLTVK